MKLELYMFEWNGRRRFVEATTEQQAKDKFMLRYGFWPELPVIMTITLVKDEN